jgi:SAM-dependent methyltransferase
LIDLVDGGPDVEWFLRTGSLAAESLRNILQDRGLSLSSFGSILDFGCGCGRVIRHIGTSAKLFGCDYNPDMIEWCSAHLATAEFSVNSIQPPTGYADGKFDLIYAFSVFTHLSEDLGHKWMAEIRRLLRPGGFLVISLHGESYVPGLNLDEKQRFLSGHVVVREPQHAGRNLCAAFHPANYVLDNLAQGLRFVDFVPQGAKGSGTQDLYLLQKPEYGSIQ